MLRFWCGRSARLPLVIYRPLAIRPAEICRDKWQPDTTEETLLSSCRYAAYCRRRRKVQFHWAVCVNVTRGRCRVLQDGASPWQAQCCLVTLFCVVLILASVADIADVRIHFELKHFVVPCRTMWTVFSVSVMLLCCEL